MNHLRTRPIRVIVALIAAVVAAVGSLVVLPAPRASAEEPGSAEEQLARRYAPVMMLQQQNYECDPEGEPYTPMAVDDVLDNPQISLRQVGAGDPVVKWAPSGEDLYGLREGFYIDMPGIALDPGCLYEQDSRDLTRDKPATIYAHIVKQRDHPDLLVLQYWFFWYYNDWNNKHEGDWEGIQLIFEAADAQEALTTDPVEVGYYQHEGGERSTWTDPKLEHDGQRPVVYSSRGSHASYYGSALYLGRRGSEGFGCDDTGSQTTRIDPEVVLLPDEVDDPDSDLAWLSFLGRWGERGSGPYNGPTGPITKDRWLNPIDNQRGLRSGSVVVPAGDGAGADIADLFCSTIAWGSSQVISVKIHPLRGTILAAAIIGLLAFAIRRTSWALVDPLPIVRRRRLGEIIRASFRVFVKDPATYLLIGLASLPFALVAAGISNVARIVPGIRDLIELSGEAGDAIASLLLGGLTSLLVFMLTIAAIAWVMRESETGLTPTPADTLRALRPRIRDLTATLLRAVSIVGLLMISIVGIPWGLRQLFRYQFIAQTAMLEERRGTDALSRSSDLVKGRWWYTTFAITILNVGVALITVTIGLVALIVLRPPFWTLSVIMVAVEVALIPLAAIIITLLYGDAAAKHAERGGDGPEGRDGSGNPGGQADPEGGTPSLSSQGP